MGHEAGDEIAAGIQQRWARLMLNYNAQAPMPLNVLLDGFVAPELLVSCNDIEIGGLAIDSRKVKKNDLFFARQGELAHGLMFADEAIKNGAVAVLWDECQDCEETISKISQQVASLQCENLLMKMGEIADRFYRHPSAQLKVIGVTGTNGKTSIAHFIAQCMDAENARCGVLGTLGNGFLGDLVTTGLTTTDVLSVHRDLDILRANGASHVVMEVSSHGLDQDRVNGVHFDTAVFTNLSHEHLDYHETMTAYAEVKRKLFFMPGLKTAVINLDDEYGRNLASECMGHLTVWGYSTQPELKGWSDYAGHLVQATALKAVAHGFELTIKTPQGRAELQIALLGWFNVSNVLAVLSTLLINELSLETAVNKLAVLKAVPGRMEIITADQGVTVVVDFAHTPKALEAACEAVKQHFDGRFWCVFGCGGDRDRSKRPLMARVAESYADKVVLTSDNPRSENPQDILAEIAEGFEDAARVEVIPDRREAIAYAIAQAEKEPADKSRTRKNNVVLLAGKGHESMQIIGDKSIAFDDRQVAKECLGLAS